MAYLLIFLFYCVACLVLPVHDGLSVLSKGSNPTFHFQVGEVIFNPCYATASLAYFHHFAFFCCRVLKQLDVIESQCRVVTSGPS